MDLLINECPQKRQMKVSPGFEIMTIHSSGTLIFLRYSLLISQLHIRYSSKYYELINNCEINTGAFLLLGPFFPDISSSAVAAKIKLYLKFSLA